MSDSFGHELGTVLICHKIQEHRFLITFLKSYLSTYPLVACGIWWRKKTGMMITTAMSVISGLAFGCLFGVVVFMFSCGRYGLSHSFSLFGVLVSFVMLGIKTPAYSYCVTTCKYTLYFPVIALWAQCDPAHTDSSKCFSSPNRKCSFSQLHCCKLSLTSTCLKGFTLQSLQLL